MKIHTSHSIHLLWSRVRCSTINFNLISFGVVLGDVNGRLLVAAQVWQVAAFALGGTSLRILRQLDRRLCLWL